MAERLTTIRPASDNSLAHDCSSGSSGYAMIDDEAHDSDLTYISATYSNSGGTTESVFALSVPSITDKDYTVTNVTMHMVARRTGTLNNLSCNCYFEVGNYTGTKNTSMAIQVSSLSTSYADKTATSSTMVDKINEYVFANGSFPTIYAHVVTGGTSNSSKNSYAIRITQIYVEVTYQIPSVLKVKDNGSYVTVQKAYKKVSGHWVEQTDLSTVFDTNTKYIKG